MGTSIQSHFLTFIPLNHVDHYAHKLYMGGKSLQFHT